MKTLILILLVVTLLPFQAEEAQPVQAISEALRTSKIPKLELNEASFGDAIAMVRDEWERQHPKLDFPVASAEYKKF